MGHRARGYVVRRHSPLAEHVSAELDAARLPAEIAQDRAITLPGLIKLMETQREADLADALRGISRPRLASIFRADFWHGWVASRVAAV